MGVVFGFSNRARLFQGKEIRHYCHNVACCYYSYFNCAFFQFVVFVVEFSFSLQYHPDLKSSKKLPSRFSMICYLDYRKAISNFLNRRQQ